MEMRVRGWNVLNIYARMLARDGLQVDVHCHGCLQYLFMFYLCLAREFASHDLMIVQINCAILLEACLLEK
jgi:hypothetical protein